MLNGNKSHALEFWELEWHETWATEILVDGNNFFNLCKIIPLAMGNHRHPFSVFFFFFEEGGGCTRAIPSSWVFLITPILFILSKVNAPKQHLWWSQLRNRKNKKNYPNFSISKVQRNHRSTQRQFSENVCSEDDLRSRIFGTFVVKFLACLLLLGFSNI